jgi:hypothetical protein
MTTTNDESDFANSELVIGFSEVNNNSSGLSFEVDSQS